MNLIKHNVNNIYNNKKSNIYDKDKLTPHPSSM